MITLPNFVLSALVLVFALVALRQWQLKKEAEELWQKYEKFARIFINQTTVDSVLQDLAQELDRTLRNATKDQLEMLASCTAPTDASIERLIELSGTVNTQAERFQTAQRLAHERGWRVYSNFQDYFRLPTKSDSAIAS